MGRGWKRARQLSAAPVPTRQLFFKALKQGLKIKTFVGTSENAVQIQIWTALIAMPILKYLQLKSSFGWSLVQSDRPAAPTAICPPRPLGMAQ